MVYPAVPTAWLVRLVGPARAKYLLFTADLIDAERAAAFGLVDEVAPAGEVEGRALALARTIAARSPQNLGAAKDVVDAVVAGDDPQRAVAS
ncbi:enoyl-CoA hydratase/isomerase family protein [Planosporangium sp. 12N6]|uniref:enoyl-CoA hydratase/isomerase family protein n=1 Tax=Planosporangium spinosum TaxID=3402278 RepID=UPI003CEC8634